MDIAVVKALMSRISSASQAAKEKGRGAFRSTAVLPTVAVYKDVPDMACELMRGSNNYVEERSTGIYQGTK